GNRLGGVRAARSNPPLSFNLHQGGYPAKIWNHMAATFVASASTLTLYLNGTWAAQQSLGARSIGNSLPLEIGRQGPQLGRYWRGKLDDIRVWNVVRKPSEIQANYLAELASPQSGLTANWQFDDV